MAEINSIANGTYTIGDTNNLTFEAGPGIKIDSPSAGTVRIGNDETVLWEGDMFLSANSSFTANDSFLNYEKIDFYILEHTEVGDVHIDSHKGGNTTVGNVQRYDLFCPGLPDGASGTIRFNHAVVTGSNNVYKVYAAGQHSLENTTVAKATCPAKLRKVIGLNRISGSNA